MKKITFLGFSAILLLVFWVTGDVEYREYRFSSEKVTMGDGTLFVALDGEYGDSYTNKNITFQDWGAPYRLKFWLEYPLNENLYSMSVSNIIVKGVETSYVLELGEAEFIKFIDPSVKNSPLDYKKIVSAVWDISGNDLKYEDVTITAKVTVFTDKEKFIKKDIILRLNKKFFKHKRWSWWENIMSV